MQTATCSALQVERQKRLGGQIGEGGQGQPEASPALSRADLKWSWRGGVHLRVAETACRSRYSGQSGSSSPALVSTPRSLACEAYASLFSCERPQAHCPSMVRNAPSARNVQICATVLSTLIVFSAQNEALHWPTQNSACCIALHPSQHPSRHINNAHPPAHLRRSALPLRGTPAV